MIDVDEVIRIHSILIDEFGGSKGIRDLKLLDSAIKRPFQTFDKLDLYPSVI
jgi:death on curing protein